VPSKNLRREILLIETPPGKRDYPSVTDSIVLARRASTRPRGWVGRCRMKMRNEAIWTGPVRCGVRSFSKMWLFSSGAGGGETKRLRAIFGGCTQPREVDGTEPISLGRSPGGERGHGNPATFSIEKDLWNEAGRAG
jgi:hypothetical protein